MGQANKSNRNRSRSTNNRKATSCVQHLNLPGKDATIPYSDGVLVGNTLYISGRVGLDPATGFPPVDVDEEVRLMLESFQSVLRAANMNPDHLVWVQVFSTDLSLWEHFNAIYRRMFGKCVPARTFVATELLRGLRFEINGIAVGES
jgi:enamine deaminase RidA (YjgF/YER057c/UK114 family)